MSISGVEEHLPTEETELWNMPLQIKRPVAWQATDPEAPELVVSRTLEILEKQGYCLWTCHRLASVVICLVKDGRVNDGQGHRIVSLAQACAMQQYPVYSLEEVEMLADVNEWTERMVLEAKRLAGAVVTMVIRNWEARRPWRN